MSYFMGRDESTGSDYIDCLVCGKRSYNRNDIFNRYCGNCHQFHGPIELPSHCWDCGVVLKGGATRHKEGCYILDLIRQHFPHSPQAEGEKCNG